MELNETIILRDNEYTLTLNRESAVKIEQYAKVQESMNEVTKPAFEYYDENINLDNVDPFAKEFDEEKLAEEVDKKELILKKTISKAFWIWLYPKHKLEYSKVYELVCSYIESDNEEESQFIGSKYAEYFDESIKIRTKFLEEQKKLKAQIMKNK